MKLSAGAAALVGEQRPGVALLAAAAAGGDTVAAAAAALAPATL